MDPLTLAEDAHLAARGFFTSVEDPEWDRRPLVGMPWRFAGCDPLALTPPPRVHVLSEA